MTSSTAHPHAHPSNPSSSDANHNGTSPHSDPHAHPHNSNTHSDTSTTPHTNDTATSANPTTTAPNRPLAGIRVASVATNIPGPTAVARLVDMGADATKIEPPSGDLMAWAAPEYYHHLAADQTIITTNGKTDEGKAKLDDIIGNSDIFITSSRPSALARLGLDWQSLHTRFPRLIMVAIVGFPGERAEEPGHDLNYQASHGLIQPPHMPTTLVADLAGAERATAAALLGLYLREHTGEGSFHEVALSDAADAMAAPFRYGMTKPGGMLGGALPHYNLYEAADGWISLAALEGHFWARFCQVVGIDAGSNMGEDGKTVIAELAKTKSCSEWEQLAAEHDLPIVACR